MRNMLEFFSFLTGKLRLGNPWNYKVPALIAVPYFMLLVNAVPNNVAYLAIILSFCTIIGIAGIGYLTNDLADQEQDKRAGKRNATRRLSSTQLKLLFAFFFVMALGPWLWFPLSTRSIVLLFGEILLFFLYAFPPLRLKEKPLAGIITDSLYAHVIPALLAAETFYLIGGKQYTLFPYFLFILAVWQFCLGLRNILLHQLADQQNDAKSETTTFITHHGTRFPRKLIRWILLPGEWISFVVLSYIISIEIIYFLPFLLGFWAITAWRKREENRRSLRLIAYGFMDGFYIQWMPLLLLTGMIFHPIEVTPILLLHLILFRNGLKSLFARIGKKILGATSKLMTYNTYLQGLWRHLLVFMGYSCLFIPGYFVLMNYLPEDQQLHYQRWLSKFFMLAMVSHLIWVVKVRFHETKAMLQGFLFSKGSAYNLAIVRILFMLTLVNAYTYWALPDLSLWASLPESAREALPFMGWLIHSIPISPDIYIGATIGAIICAYAAVFGVFTRTALWLHLVFALYVWGIPCFFGKLNHNQIAIWVSLLLAVTPCADALSIDSLFKKYIWPRKSLPAAPHVKYGLPLRLIWLMLAVIYFFSGFHKLWDTGLAWALSDSAVNQLHLEWAEHYDKMPGIRIDRYPYLVQAGAFSVLLFELFYPLLLFHPVLRLLIVVGAQSFHRITGYFIYIDFGKLRTLHHSFINWHWLFLKAKELVGLKIGPTANDYHHSAYKAEPVNLKPLIPMLVVGGLLLGINGSFSLFGIHSYPFSAYPSYSAYVEDEFKMIEFHAYGKRGNEIPVKAFAEDENFRWENIRPFENDIAQLVEANDTMGIQEELHAYWELWRTKTSHAKQATKIEFFLVTTSLAPEERTNIIDKKHLGTLTYGNNKENE